MSQKQKQGVISQYGIAAFLKFLIPSLIGAGLFLIPIPHGGSFTVSAGIIIDWVSSWGGDWFWPLFSMILVVVAALGAIVYRVLPKKPGGMWKILFDAAPVYLVFRILGAILIVMTYFELGPEFIWSGATGGTMLGLMNTLAANFLVCGFLLPLLLDFGSMDYVGILIRGVMRPLFTIPGRSSLDCLASFIGNGTVGIVITSKQYDEGYYTAREASVIATCFSIVSIPFCLVVAKFLTVETWFFPMYMTIVVACVILAIILPRIWPLNKIRDTYYEPVGKRVNEAVPEGISTHDWALKQGIDRAAQNHGWGGVAVKGINTVLDVWINLLPVVMFGGTVALVLAEYTPLFTWIGYPFQFVLEWLRIPEAAAAAPGVVAGFADMFLPAILGANIVSDMTRFFICVVSLTQLIFVTENVMILLRCNIPIKLGQLFVIYLERTVVAILVAALSAHILF